MFQDDLQLHEIEQQEEPNEISLHSPSLSASDSYEPSTSQTPTPKPTEARPKRKQKMTAAEELMQLTGQHLKSLRTEDEYEAYGKYVAHKLRSLRGNQAVFARKLINDVIYHGEIEELDKNFEIKKNISQLSTLSLIHI